MIFPVKVPYTVSADMVKYEGEVYNSRPSEMYLSQKRIELARFTSEVSATLPLAQEYINAMAGYLKMNHLKTIEDIALQLEEDIAILHNGELVSICFCFPSSFIPTEKIGMNFFDMHLPVADGERLRAASEKVTQLISKEGACFRRYVWTITPLEGLSQHPSIERATPASINQLYFRTETQTTVGLANNICLFFVKVEMTPLAECWSDEFQRNQIMDSINSMSEAVLDYKNLHHIKSLLISGRVE